MHNTSWVIFRGGGGGGQQGFKGKRMLPFPPPPNETLIRHDYHGHYEFHTWHFLSSILARLSFHILGVG